MCSEAQRQVLIGVTPMGLVHTFAPAKSERAFRTLSPFVRGKKTQPRHPFGVYFRGPIPVEP